MLVQVRLKVNWKLLIWPSLCHQTWFGAEYTFSAGAPFLRTQPVSVIPSPSQEPLRMRRAASEMTAIVAVTRVAPIIPRLCKWTGLWQLLNAIPGWTGAHVETVTLLCWKPLCFKALQRSHRPWRVFLDVSFLVRAGVWFSLGNLPFSTNKQHFQPRRLVAPSFLSVAPENPVTADKFITAAFVPVLRSFP